MQTKGSKNETMPTIGSSKTIKNCAKNGSALMSSIIGISTEFNRFKGHHCRLMICVAPGILCMPGNTINRVIVV